MATTSLGKATLRCSCGSEDFVYPADRKLKPTDAIRCASCGHEGTVQSVRQQSIKAAEKAIADALRKQLKLRK